MQEAISRPIAFPIHRAATAMDAVVEMRRASFSGVLHSAFATFARYPAHILACSFVCFAGAAIVGALLYSTLTLDGLSRSRNYFITSANVFYLQMQVQAAVGAFTFLLGRGAITWIALRSQEEATIQNAFRAALRRWKPLLASGLIYGLLITISLIGITWLLREGRMDVSNSNYRWVRRDANSIIRTAIVQSIGMLPPDPGSPFTELYSATRFALSRQNPGYSSYQPTRSLPTPLLLAGVAGLLLAFTVETLLCMRTAVIMQSRGGHPLGWLGDTVRLSARHFWRVAAWRWSMRLALVALYTACLTLPMAVHQGVMVPVVVNQVRSYWPYLLNATSYGIGIALVSMILIPFNLIFEAHMYAALVTDPRPASRFALPGSAPKTKSTSQTSAAP